jgi:transcriptional regulator with XRE-family HTH domain
MEQPIEYGAGVGHKIRKVRELRSLTQEKMANELGMTTSGYSRIERGEVKLSIDRLERIAEVLGVQPIDLTNFDETIFFTNYGTAQDQSFSVTTDGDAMRHERATFEARIADLKEEIAFLRALLGVRSVDLPVVGKPKRVSGRGPARPTATTKGKRPPKAAA